MIFFVSTKKQGNDAMHAKGFLHKLLTPVIHKTRVKALSEIITAAITTKKLMLTALGRAIDSPIQERSKRSLGVAPAKPRVFALSTQIEFQPWSITDEIKSQAACIFSLSLYAIENQLS
jgi:hypothetical protein